MLFTEEYVDKLEKNIYITIIQKLSIIESWTWNIITTVENSVVNFL